MIRLFSIAFLSLLATLFVFGGEDPNLDFNNIYLTYGDAPVQLRVDDKYESKTSYSLVGNNNVVSLNSQTKTITIRNAGQTKVRAYYSGGGGLFGNKYNPVADTITLVVEEKSITLKPSHDELIYGDEFEPDINNHISLIDGVMAYGESLSIFNEYLFISSPNIPEGNYPSAGEHKIILNLVEQHPNYIFRFEDGNFTVKKKELIIKVDDEKKYGENIPPSFKYTVTGFVRNENEQSSNISYTLSCDEIEQFSDVGIYLDFKVYPETSDNWNYTLTVQGAMKIIPAEIHIYAGEQVIMYGFSNYELQALTYETPEWLNDEKDPFDFISEPKFESIATKNSDAGQVHLLTFGTGISHKNYIVTPHPGSLRINPRILLAHVNDYYKYFGDLPDPQLNKGIWIDPDNFRNGDNYSVFDNFEQWSQVGDTIYGANLVSFTDGTEVFANSMPGTYDIEYTAQFRADNYVVLPDPGLYHILRAPIKIEISRLDMLNTRETNPKPSHSLDLSRINHKIDLGNLGFNLSGYRLQDEFRADEKTGKYLIDYSDASHIAINANPEYNIEVVPNYLYVHDSIGISTEPNDIQTCRDATSIFAITTETVNPSYEWQIQFPGEEFTPINETIQDTLNLRGVDSNALLLDSVLSHFINFGFKCVLSSSFLVDSSSIKDTLVPQELVQMTIESREVGISIKDTPDFAKVALKGGSILICMTQNEDKYQWGIENGPDLAGETMNYIDISNYPYDKNLYWVKTTDEESSCTTKSSLSTKNGHSDAISPPNWIPSEFILGMSQNPANEYSPVTIKVDNPLENQEYWFKIYDQCGRSVGSEDKGFSGSGPVISKPKSFRKGVYIVEFLQKDQTLGIYQRKAEKLIVR